MEFDFEIRHIPRKANSRADALSRRPDYDQGVHDNENIIVLPDHVFIRAVTITSEEECYVTVGTFTRRGLDSISNDTELSWFGFGVLSPKGT